ncbi:UNKNOWN [Stylonychia lemnae]|uniref:Uncharacterized protein n=1 Tax=Stylonychia lemnae TaxID=5949 RepID=A0A078AKE8_STYLE|nr:UNKNOWN [Stylonychia lemnae]|eukprot:CDW81293.1 UNKNOWN [Stylonychia lemnae]
MKIKKDKEAKTEKQKPVSKKEQEKKQTAAIVKEKEKVKIKDQPKSKDKKKQPIQTTLPVSMIGKRSARQEPAQSKIKEIPEEIHLEEENKESKKGKRGKKICPQCNDYVPIHSQICKICKHEFHMNHKPKTPKPPPVDNFQGEVYLSFDQMQRLNSSVSFTLQRNKFYGNLSAKHAYAQHQQKECEKINSDNKKKAEQKEEQKEIQDSDQNADDNDDVENDSPVKSHLRAIQLQQDLKTQLKNQNYIKKSLNQHYTCKYIEDLQNQRISYENIKIDQPIKEDDIGNIKQQEIIYENIKYSAIKKSATQINDQICAYSFGEKDKTKVIKIQWIQTSSKEQRYILAQSKEIRLKPIQTYSEDDELIKFFKVRWLPFVTSSMDGYLKIFDLDDMFVPIYEYFSSKIIQKKFNFFSENIINTWSSIYDDFIYSTGINGILYKISKKLYSKNECAIVSFDISESAKFNDQDKIMAIVMRNSNLLVLIKQY